jgi:RNA polymerase sigma factor (sigma-70 family)
VPYESTNDANTLGRTRLRAASDVTAPTGDRDRGVAARVVRFPDVPSPSDDALVSGMADGDDASAVAFVRRYQRRAFGLAVGIVADRATAEDVAQEALVRAWRHASMFDVRRGSVEAWVLTITRNLAIDALRRRRSIPTDPDRLMALAAASGTAWHDDPRVSGPVSTRVMRALEGLPAEQRRAVLLAALYGRTAQEISESEGVPLGTVKTRVRTGLTKLRTQLEDLRSEEAR